MATTQRPLKECSVRTYQEKVGLGFVDILASEMDADLDTIYAAWNGGVDSVTLKDGAVITPKIADGAVTTAKIGDVQVTAAKLAVGAAARGIGYAQFPNAWSSTLYGQWVTLLSVPVTTRGGLVLVCACPGAYGVATPTLSSITIALFLDGAVHSYPQQFNLVALGGTTHVPVPSLILPDTPAAGTHTYDYRVFQADVNGVLGTPAANTGFMSIVEFS